MAISVYPLEVVEETLLVAERTANEQIIHVMGIQLTLSSPTPNMLLIPLPTSTLTNDNILDFDGGVMDSIKLALSLPTTAQPTYNPSPQPYSLQEAGKQMLARFSPSEVIVDIRHYLSEFYPDNCIFAAAIPAMEETQVTLWCWYRPNNPDLLSVPTFRGDGEKFPLKEEVRVDTTIILGTAFAKAASHVVLTEGFPQMLHLDLSPTTFHGWYSNADMVITAEALRAGLKDVIRRKPFFGIH